MTLRGKIVLAQAPLIVGLATFILLGSTTVERLGRSSQRILRDNYRSVLAAQQMNESIERLDQAALFIVAGRREQALAQADPNRARFEAELRVQEGNITEPGEGEATKLLRARWSAYQSAFDRFRSRAAGGDPAATYAADLGPPFSSVKQSVERILAINEDAIVAKSDVTQRSAARLDSVIIGVGLGLLLFGIVGSAIFTTRLLRPLSVLTQAVRGLGQGDTRVRAQVGGSDEVAALAGELNTMADHLERYRRSSLGELLRAQQAAQAAIDSLPDPVLLFQTDGALVNVNEATETLLGMRVESADPMAGTDERARELVLRIRDHVRSGKGPYLPRGLEDAVSLPTREGPRYFLPRAMPVIDQDGALAGVTVLLQEVTRLRRFDEIKNDLVATVAHEFRTPLTSLRMAIHLCLEEAAGPLTPKQADLLHASRQDCERLQNIVDDILDLSRIQAGKIELRARPISSSAILDAALDAFRGPARDAQLELALGDRTVDVPVVADPERLQVVLNNLVTNAMRHTPHGGRIALSATAGDGEVRFEVSDSGDGISPEHLPRLFERFYRIPGSNAGGAGLGLFICKEIVEAHGGRIGVDSAPGRGSSFWFTLPRARA